MPTAGEFANWPRWAVMWGLSFAIYAALKILSWCCRTKSSVPAWKHLAYLLAWPGMDADAFLGTRKCCVSVPSIAEWFFAAGKLAFGIEVIWGVVPRLESISDYVVAWVGMIGVVFALHFGLFHVLSCGWRAVGIAAVPIMNWPVASQSLAEFWGRRWNLAFRDLTHRFLFRPLQRPLGPTRSLLIGFLVSGVVHDLVISLPAGGGWGLPTLYFVIQGAAIMIERSRFGRRCGLSRGIPGHAYALTCTLLPAPLLFHPPFACHVILPFLAAIGARP